MNDDLVLDGFAGPGGWSVGLQMLGLRDVGLEWDTAACKTRAAAGHLTIQCDIARYPTAPFKGRIKKQIWSPPCQAWSDAGKQLGLVDQPLVHQSVRDLAAGRDTRAELKARCLDERSLLAAEPMRWLHDLRPEWVAMEEVPKVLPLWRQYAQILRGWGYSVWCGVLNSADYGVGQARRRAILVASRVRAVSAPDPTYAENPAHDLFGQCLPRWISMADALGWGYTDRPAPTVTGGGYTDRPAPTVTGGGYTDRPAPTVTGGGTETGGAEPWSSTSRAAMRAAMDNPGHWAWRKPAPTVTGTVGHVGGKQVGGHLNLECEEAAVLQSFPRDYPFQGNKGQRSLQIGNAVPPLLAAHVVSAATGIPLPTPHRLAPAA